MNWTLQVQYNLYTKHKISFIWIIVQKVMKSSPFGKVYIYIFLFLFYGFYLYILYLLYLLYGLLPTKRSNQLCRVILVFTAGSCGCLLVICIFLSFLGLFSKIYLKIFQHQNLFNHANQIYNYKDCPTIPSPCFKWVLKLFKWVLFIEQCSIYGSQFPGGILLLT